MNNNNKKIIKELRTPLLKAYKVKAMLSKLYTPPRLRVRRDKGIAMANKAMNINAERTKTNKWAYQMARDSDAQKAAKPYRRVDTWKASFAKQTNAKFNRRNAGLSNEPGGDTTDIRRAKVARRMRVVGAAGAVGASVYGYNKGEDLAKKELRKHKRKAAVHESTHHRETMGSDAKKGAEIGAGAIATSRAVKYGHSLHQMNKSPKMAEFEFKYGARHAKLAKRALKIAAGVKTVAGGVKGAALGAAGGAAYYGGKKAIQKLRKEEAGKTMDTDKKNKEEFEVAMIEDLAKNLDPNSKWGEQPINEIRLKGIPLPKLSSKAKGRLALGAAAGGVGFAGGVAAEHGAQKHLDRIQAKDAANARWHPKKKKMMGEEKKGGSIVTRSAKAGAAIGTVTGGATGYMVGKVMGANAKGKAVGALVGAGLGAAKGAVAGAVVGKGAKVLGGNHQNNPHSPITKSATAGLVIGGALGAVKRGGSVMKGSGKGAVAGATIGLVAKGFRHGKPDFQKEEKEKKNLDEMGMLKTVERKATKFNDAAGKVARSAVLGTATGGPIHGIKKAADKTRDLMDESLSTDVYGRIDTYKKMGFRVSDVSVSDNKAEFTVTDKEGSRKRHMFANGKRQVQDLGSVKPVMDNDSDDAVVTKKKRGRPPKKK